jgi:hypothetical protein
MLGENNVLLLTFVHLGNRVPEHLSLNILQCKREFPDLEILLVGDSQITRILAENLGVIYHEYSKQDQYSRLALKETLLEHDPMFWGGYWQKTFDRLLSLESAHLAFPEFKLIHIESDVILFRDFPFSAFTSVKKLAWISQSHEYDIAAIVFSPDPTHSRWLAEKLIEESRLDPSTGDMSALRKIRVADSGLMVSLLPKFPNDSGGFPDTAGGSSILFDGSHYGQWLMGWDPNAHWGFGRNKYWTGSGGNPLESFDFYVKSGALKFDFENRSYVVVNMHVHCKDPKMFGEFRNGVLERAATNLKRNHILYYFKIGSFFSWLTTMTKRWSVSIFSATAWFGLLSRMVRGFQKSKR